MKTIYCKVRIQLIIGVVIIMQLAVLTSPILTFAQEPVYVHKDKSYKFEVNLPKKPEKESDKPFLRKITCNQSLSLAFLTFVLSSEVKSR